MNNYISLASLSMDLKRAALGYYGNSKEMAECFYQEALRRKEEIDIKSVSPYLVNLLDKVDQLKKVNGNLEKAEIAHTLSILFQNAAVTLANNQK